MHDTDSSIFISLTGLPGSGKTTLGRCLDSDTPAQIDPNFSEHFTDIRTIPMRWLLAQHGYDGSNTIAGLQSFHQKLRDSDQSERIFDNLLHIKESIVIIDAVRNIDDLRYLKDNFNSLTIGLQAPLYIAKERFMHDQDDDKHRHSVEHFGRDIQGNHTLDERKVLARERAWNQAISEAGDDPENYDCVMQADKLIITDEHVSFSQVALTAKGYIREFVNERLKAGLVESEATMRGATILPPALT
jgi:hypothetical protein